MLIIEIALGILLGFLLIKELPHLLEGIGWAFLAFISVGGALLFGWFAYFTFTEHFALFAIIVSIACVFGIYKWYTVHYAELNEIRALEKFIEQKEKLGYNMSKERLQVKVQKDGYDAKKNKTSSYGPVGKLGLFRGYKTEQERRRAFGYDE